MNKDKMTKIGIVLIAMTLISITFTSIVVAQPDYVPLGCSNKTTESPSPSGGKVVSLATPPTWTANTDIYLALLQGVWLHCTSTSRSSGGSPYDINTIGVRGRIWVNDKLKHDETVTNYNSADASLQWCSGYYSGNMLGRGNHVFVLTGYNSWYPVTEDTTY
jgi:hypothetical protein